MLLSLSDTVIAAPSLVAVHSYVASSIRSVVKVNLFPKQTSAGAVIVTAGFSNISAEAVASLETQPLLSVITTETL